MRLESDLVEEHERLDRLFDDLLNIIHGDDRAAMRTKWNEFERALEAHFRFEELEILPRLELTRPNVVERVQREHKELRKQLAELGVALELHLVREDMVERFVATLRAHAAWEAERFYPLAQHVMETRDTLGLGQIR